MKTKEEKEMQTEVERSIDMKQLLVIILSEWKWMVVFFFIGAICTGLYSYTKNPQGDYEMLIQRYQEEKEYYDKLKTIYDRYTEQTLSVLSDGVKHNLSDNVSDLEQLYYENLSLMYYEDYLKPKAEQLREPAKPNNSDCIIYTYIIKHAIIGGIAAILLTSFILAAYLVFCGRFLSTYEIAQCYNIKLISVITQYKSSKILGFGRDGRFIMMTAEDQWKMAIENIRQYANGANEIVAIETRSKCGMDKIRERLSKETGDISFECISKVSIDAGSMIAIKDFDNFVLVERLVSSRLEDMDYVINMLTAHNKHIIGVIGVI